MRYLFAIHGYSTASEVKTLCRYRNVCIIIIIILIIIQWHTSESIKLHCA